jgi:thiol:disulfide interchange protein DsbD
MFCRATRLGLLCFAAIALVAGSAAAQSPKANIPHGTIELIAEHQSIAPGQGTTLGLHFQLEKGWHTYWQNSGDSGEPPRVKWDLPASAAVGDIEWPAPHRFQTSANIVDFGHEGAVTLLVPLRSAKTLAAGGPVRIAADLSVLVCREICIPGKAHISITLPIRPGSSAPNPATQNLFASARKSLPRPLPAGWKLTARDAGDSFILRLDGDRQPSRPFFFPLEGSQIENSAPQTVEVIAGATRAYQWHLRKSKYLLKPIARLKGVLVLQPGEAYAIDVAVAPPAGQPPAPSKGFSDFAVHRNSLGTEEGIPR